MISDVIAATGRERGARVPISILCLAETAQSAQATMKFLLHCLSSGRFPHITALPFPWPQLNPAQRIGLTCYVGLSTGMESSSLHEGTRGLLQANSPMSLLGPHPCLCSVIPLTADGRPPISVSSPLTMTQMSCPL